MLVLHVVSATHRMRFRYFWRFVVICVAVIDKIIVVTDVHQDSLLRYGRLPFYFGHRSILRQYNEFLFFRSRKAILFVVELSVRVLPVMRRILLKGELFVEEELILILLGGALEIVIEIGISSLRSLHKVKPLWCVEAPALGRV